MDTLLIKKFLLILFSGVIFVYSCCPYKGFNSAFAQELQNISISSSPNPVGAGARALGMGGAFIAIADDATAASWNPAGLAHLARPEISFVGAAFHRSEDNAFATHPEMSGDQTVSDKNINYLSASYPFRFLGRNMNISLTYQNLYDFTREWQLHAISETKSFSTEQHIDYDRNGSLSSIGVAYSIRLLPQLSFGLTLNIWDDGLYKNEWEERVFQKISVTLNSGGTSKFDTFISDKYSFSGVNANVGILWDVNRNLTIGAVIKTPFEADLKHEHIENIVQSSYNSAENNAPDFRNETMDMPMSYGIGFAYRFTDEFAMSLDIYRTEWDDFIFTDYERNELSPITGQLLEKSDIDPTCQVRMGAEYFLVISKYRTIIPLRWGIFYDPAPAEGRPDDYFGFSIGSGIAIMDYASFDIAYQYRFGNNVGTSMMQGFDFSQDLDEHTVYSSVIIYF